MRQVQVEFLLEAEEPICHARGNEGNMTIIHREPVRQPDGVFEEVPMVSGAAMRHGMREAVAYATLDAAGMLGTGALTESALRLLFSGGQLVTKDEKVVAKKKAKGDAGPVVDLARDGSGSANLADYRAMTELVPSLRLFGGCAQNRMIPGYLQVGSATLLCEETEHVAPRWCVDLVKDQMGFKDLALASEHIHERVSYRHDVMLQPSKRELLLPEVRERMEHRLALSESASAADDVVAAKAYKTESMPFSNEELKRGSLFYWRVDVTLSDDPIDMSTFVTALGGFLFNARVGGKQSDRHGHIRPIAGRLIALPGWSQRVAIAREQDAGSGDALAVRKPTGDITNLDHGTLPVQRESFADYVATRKDKIAAFLAQVSA